MCIKVLHCDHSGEYLSNDFSQHLGSHGTMYCFMVHDMPQQNGVAERLNGIELYVAREKLPATDEDEYYHADLIGLAAVTTADEPLGRVVAIHNFGAGDIIEIAPPDGATLLLPFTNAVVPTVDLAGGRVVIELPEEIEGEDTHSG